MSDKVKLVLIASGSGTDAEAIIRAYRAGFLQNVEIVALISTKFDAGCLVKARTYGIRDIAIKYSRKHRKIFNSAIKQNLEMLGAQLVFLVGCIHPIPLVQNINMYNIHPADIHKHGGKGMYGLNTHKHVLREIQDLITRGHKTIHQEFFTTVTVHEVAEKYDSGYPLLMQSVEIPKDIIELSFLGEEEAAKQLQQHVLPYEWEMLPTAVSIAAQKILDRRAGRSTGEDRGE